MWNSDKSEYSYQNDLSEDIKAEALAIVIEKCWMLNNLKGKNRENVDDLGSPETQDLLDHKADTELWIFSHYPFRHIATLHCAERKAKTFVN